MFPIKYYKYSQKEYHFFLFEFLVIQVRLRDEERAQKLEESRRRTNEIIEAQIEQGEENR